MIEVFGHLGEPSAQVRAAAADAALVVGGARALDALGVPAPRRVVLGLIGPAIEAMHAVEATDPGARIVVLASGDPLFFGVVRRMRSAGLRPTVHTAPSSVAAAFAAVALPWEDAQVVSAHGFPVARAVNACRALPKVAVLTAPGRGLAELVAGLSDLDRTYVVAERLGETDERVRVLDTAGAAAAAAVPPGGPDALRSPNVVLVLASMPEEAVTYGVSPFVGGMPLPTVAAGGAAEACEVDGVGVADGAANDIGAVGGAEPAGAEPVDPSPAAALVFARELPTLGDCVWVDSSEVARQVGELARRNRAAVVAFADHPWSPPGDPDLVVADASAYEDVLAALAGRPSRVVLVGPDDQGPQGAESCLYSSLHALDVNVTVSRGVAP